MLAIFVYIHYTLMLPAPFQNALVLSGPTGSGKTKLSIEVALRINAEIISMDSMALYRGMDIGTAKPTRGQRATVPHHLIDVLEPWESGSVAWWLGEARRCCREIEGRGKRVLFAGGTPLYLKALIHGLFDGPPADETIRQRLHEEARLQGSASLHERLAQVDPICAGRIHPHDVRRMVRALEVFELTGRPLSAWQTQWITGMAATSPAILWLDLPRQELYDNINHRVEEMFAAGWLEEVRQLQSLQPPISLEASKALGYNIVLELLLGAITLEEATRQVQTRSRNYAKRQLNWFRHLPECLPATKESIWALWPENMS